jgi:MoxR-like ATPase
MTTQLDKFKNVEKQLNSYFVERLDEIRGLTLALLSQNNVLYLGPPGISKSYLVKAWSMCIQGANYFEHLLTKFTVPDELAGPFSLSGLENDKFIRNTTNMLPEAHIAFLDEIWKGNSGVLNFLLKLANERTFFNNGEECETPILTIVGASNEIPEDDDNLEALQDRFIIKFMVKAIQEQENFIKMVSSDDFVAETFLTLNDIEEAHTQIAKVKMPKEMSELLYEIKVELKNDEIVVTDRTLKKAVNILKSEAWLDGSKEVNEDHFDCLQHVLWTDPDHSQKTATKLFGLVDPARSKMLAIMDDCKDLFADLSKKKKAETKEDLQEIMEGIVKLKAAKVRLTELYKEAVKAKNRKKQQKTAEQMIKQVNVMVGKLASYVGFDDV